jgi:uncharacterized membrane protein
MSKQLVLAFFDNEPVADEAVEALKRWDKATSEVKLGAIGVLVKDDKGKIKTNKLGKRRTGTWAIGFGLAALLTGGMTVLGGAVLGGILGSFSRKGLGISKEDLARIDGQLNNGRAAVAVVASHEGEAGFLTKKLAELGGVPETHEISDEAVEEATAVAEEAAPKETAEDAPAATDAAPEQPAA